MESESRQAHWENVYTRKGENEVSWFQENPAASLELIAQVGAAPTSAIIDIGGGASRLVDCLIDREFADITVLDLSGAALDAAKARLGGRADQVHWVVAAGMIGRRSIFSPKSKTAPPMLRASSGV